MVDVSPIVACLDKYGTYSHTGWKTDAIGTIITTIEVCKHTGLRPLILCRLGHLTAWRLMLERLDCPNEGVFNAGNTCGKDQIISHNGYVALRNGSYEPTHKFKDEDVLFVFYATSMRSVTSKVRAIMRGVVDYGRKFCVIEGYTDWASMMYEICMSSYNAEARRHYEHDTHGLAVMADILGRYDCEPKAHREIMSALRLWRYSISLNLVYNIVPPSHGEVYVYDVTIYPVWKQTDGLEFANRVRGRLNGGSKVLAIVSMDPGEFMCGPDTVVMDIPGIERFIDDPSCRLMVASRHAWQGTFNVLGLLGKITVIVSPHKWSGWLGNYSRIVPRTGNISLEMMKYKRNC